LLTAFVRGFGWIGVDLFFVLSGFLITGVLLLARAKPNYLRNFYARRALRIWPLYYITLAFAFIVAPRIGQLHTAGLTDSAMVWLLFVQNFALPNDWDGPSSFRSLWSLAVEEQVYLILPFLVLRVAPTRRLAWAFVIAFALAIACRFALFVADAPPIAAYVLAPARMDAFAVGGLLAIWLPNARAQLRRAAPFVALLSGAVLLVVAVGSYGLDAFQPEMRTWGYSVTAVFWGGLLALVLTSDAWAGALGNPLLRRFGLYSYAIFLFHYVLWEVVEADWLAKAGNGFLSQLLAWTFMAALCLAGGWLSWVLVERRVLALKRFFATGAERSLNVHGVGPGANSTNDPLLASASSHN
jgi:peptidoglycan/LPS O-acetylase OafA/YrhL